MWELKNSSVHPSPHLLVGGPPVHAHAALALLLAVVVVEVEPALDQSEVSSWVTWPLSANRSSPGRGRATGCRMRQWACWGRGRRGRTSSGMSSGSRNQRRSWRARLGNLEINACESERSSHSIIVSYSAKFSRSCCGDDPLHHQTPRGSWGSWKLPGDRI